MLTAAVAAVAAAVVAWTPLPLERLQAEPPLAGRMPLQAKVSPGGRYVTFLKASATSRAKAGAKVWTGAKDGD